MLVEMMFSSVSIVNHNAAVFRLFSLPSKVCLLVFRLLFQGREAHDLQLCEGLSNSDLLNLLHTCRLMRQEARAYSSAPWASNSKRCALSTEYAMSLVGTK